MLASSLNLLTIFEVPTCSTTLSVYEPDKRAPYVQELERQQRLAAQKQAERAAALQRQQQQAAQAQLAELEQQRHLQEQLQQQQEVCSVLEISARLVGEGKGLQ